MSIGQSLNQFRSAFRDELDGVRAGLSGRGADPLDIYGRVRPSSDPLGAYNEAGGRQGAQGFDPLGDYLQKRGGWGAMAESQTGLGGRNDPFALHSQAQQTSAFHQQQKDAADAASVRATGVVDPGDFSGPATADDNQTLTGERIDSWVAATRPNSPLQGKGQFILDTAQKYGISAPLLLGIFLKESELGTTAGAGFNIAGVGGAGNFAQYGSWEQAIDGAARNLAGPTYRGKSAAEQVGNWYAGPQAWGTYGENATDAGGGGAPSRNGTVRDYLNGPVAAAYQGLGVPLNAGQAGTPRSTRGVPLGAGVPQSEYLDRTRGFLGIPYTSGGIRNSGNPRDGFDCSSFVGYMLGVPRDLWNAQALADNLPAVDAGQLQPGDIVLFDIKNPGDATARPVGHVAIWLGNGKIAQSTTLNGTNGVQVVDLANDDYLRQHVYGYRRYGARQQATPPARPMVRGPVRY